MASRRYVLSFDMGEDKWVLKNQSTEKIIKRFEKKEQATRTGVLQNLLGKQGGTVRIGTARGVFAEERTFRER